MKYEPEHDPWHQLHNHRWNDTKNPLRIPQDHYRPCLHPGHEFPNMLYIPQGHSYTHTCPKCGQSQTGTNNIYYCARSVN